MSHDRLAEWLANLLGDDYQRDISKLKGTYYLLFKLYNNIFDNLLMGH